MRQRETDQEKKQRLKNKKRRQQERREARRVEKRARKGQGQDQELQTPVYGNPVDNLEILIYGSREASRQINDVLSLQTPKYCPPGEIPSDPESLDAIILAGNSFRGDSRGLLIEFLRALQQPRIYLVKRKIKKDKDLQHYANLSYHVTELEKLKAELNRYAHEKPSR